MLKNSLFFYKRIIFWSLHSCPEIEILRLTLKTHGLPNSSIFVFNLLNISHLYNPPYKNILLLSYFFQKLGLNHICQKSTTRPISRHATEAPESDLPHRRCARELVQISSWNAVINMKRLLSHIIQILSFYI